MSPDLPPSHRPPLLYTLLPGVTSPNRTVGGQNVRPELGTPHPRAKELDPAQSLTHPCELPRSLSYIVASSSKFSLRDPALPPQMGLRRFERVQAAHSQGRDTPNNGGGGGHSPYNGDGEASAPPPPPPPPPPSGEEQEHELTRAGPEPATAAPRLKAFSGGGWRRAVPGFASPGDVNEPLPVGEPKLVLGNLATDVAPEVVQRVLVEYCEAGAHTRSVSAQLELLCPPCNPTYNPECVLELRKLSSDVNECKPLLRGAGPGRHGGPGGCLHGCLRTRAPNDQARPWAPAPRLRARGRDGTTTY